MSEIPIPEDFQSWAKGRLGKESSKFLSHLDESPIRGMLVNPRKDLEVEGLEKVAWNPLGCYVPEGHKFSTDPLWHAGTYYSMDASCMFLGHVYNEIFQDDNSRPKRVLDLCAAPGGKSLVLSSVMRENELLVSNEISKLRAATLKENLLKWGAAHNYILRQKPEQFQRMPGFYDLVVVDAPCSGEGMFRKRPKSREQWSSDKVKMNADRQKAILKSAVVCLQKDGHLVYCTCTFNDQENIEIVQWLCKEYGMNSVEIKTEKAWNIEERKEGNCVGYQFWPHKVKGEGFFIAVLKHGNGEQIDHDRYRSRRKIKPYPKKHYLRIKRFFNLPEGYALHEKDTKAITCCHEELMDDIMALNGLYRPSYYGVEIGMMNKDIFLPLHALALNAVVTSRQRKVELSYAEALQYLRRETLDLDYDRPGWVQASYQDISLGWMKVLIRKINNHYPINWRLKK